MSRHLKLYGATLVAFFAIDMVWLGFVAQPFYSKHLGHLLAPEVNWVAAILFYLLYIAGILGFAIVPGLKQRAMGWALLRGACYGFITYATYDLTNQATLKDWPVLVTVVDMTWGVILCTAVTFCGFIAGRRLSPDW